MTAPDALRFLQCVREDASLRVRIASSPDDVTLDGLVALGASLGWHFDAANLTQAFRDDWTMRRMFFETRAVASAAD